MPFIIIIKWYPRDKPGGHKSSSMTSRCHVAVESRGRTADCTLPLLLPAWLRTSHTNAGAKKSDPETCANRPQLSHDQCDACRTYLCGLFMRSYMGREVPVERGRRRRLPYYQIVKFLFVEYFAVGVQHLDAGIAHTGPGHHGTREGVPQWTVGVSL